KVLLGRLGGRWAAQGLGLEVMHHGLGIATRLLADALDQAPAGSSPQEWSVLKRPLLQHLYVVQAEAGQAISHGYTGWRQVRAINSPTELLARILVGHEIEDEAPLVEVGLGLGLDLRRQQAIL